ncbi:MAG: gamma-glutamyl-phosphate reductase, partial [Betaproteobacteria bacterium]|nr:gamma-glutamyl-phosphate reductase [Betaproteobacteria bacterium]
MHLLGTQARAAAALMARATAADKRAALLRLAALLRQNQALLQAENAKDLARARARS